MIFSLEIQKKMRALLAPNKIFSLVKEIQDIADEVHASFLQWDIDDKNFVEMLKKWI